METNLKHKPKRFLALTGHTLEEFSERAINRTTTNYPKIQSGQIKSV